MSRSITLATKYHSKPILSKFIDMLTKNRKRLIEMVQGLSIAELDFTPDNRKVETIGSLLIHIAGVEWSWIFEDIGDETMDDEEWKHAFALRPSVDIDQIHGNQLEYYLNKLGEVRKVVLEKLANFTDDDLQRLFQSSDDENLTVSLEFVLYHLVNHEALHEGQISLLKRLAVIS